MKAILISIQPPHTCNILNGIKLWEIRKKFPKDYVGWVYIYATKNKNALLYNKVQRFYRYDSEIIEKNETYLSGKVVARFWCDKVEEIIIEPFGEEIKDYEKEWCKKSCLSFTKLVRYLKELKGYAIHITKLEIFDKPKYISEFYKIGFDVKEYNQAVFCLKNNVHYTFEPDEYLEKYKLTRAPQSWCWIEV